MTPTRRSPSCTGRGSKKTLLADTAARSPGQGRLAPGVHAPGTLLLQLVDFIADQLPRWRDHPDRRPVHSERELTDQLSSYLNSAARESLDLVQFLTEVPDSAQRGRFLDIAIKPAGAPIVVTGRRYTLFDVLLPIECKRLPTPKGRDEREYVIGGELGSAGGIQRFKLGAHAAAHPMAVMIAYIQEGEAPQWLARVNRWISEIGEVDASWAGERLEAMEVSAVHRLRSLHRRQARGSASIELRHLWIALASPEPQPTTDP